FRGRVWPRPGSLRAAKMRLKVRGVHLASPPGAVNSAIGPFPGTNLPASTETLMHTPSSSPLAARRSGPLKGRVRAPGDKSISHRALIFGALAVGETRISGLLEGEDVLHTADAMRALGATVENRGDGEWSVRGVGVAGFREPRAVLDFGNSGT